MKEQRVKMICLKSQCTAELGFEAWSFWCQSPCYFHCTSWGKTSSGDSEIMYFSGGSALDIVCFRGFGMSLVVLWILFAF